MGTKAMTEYQLPIGSGPLCPVCDFGELWPYKVDVTMRGSWEGVGYLSGWVLVCKGRKRGALTTRDVPACGFSMPVQPPPQRVRVTYPNTTSVTVVPAGADTPE